MGSRDSYGYNHLIRKWDSIRADFLTRYTVLYDRIIRYIIRYSGMNYSILAISRVLAVAFVLTAGCTQNATPPVVTVTPTAAPDRNNRRPPDSGTRSNGSADRDGDPGTNSNAPG